MRFLIRARACLFAACISAVAGFADLRGTWALSGVSYTELYDVVAAPPPVSFSATCSPLTGPCTSWRSANLTFLNATALSIRFDSGGSDGGVLPPGAGGARIAWGDGSAWARARAPGSRLTVHIAPAMHTDPGWFSTCDELYDSLFRPALENVTLALAVSPARTFAAEIAVIWGMHYAEANATTRSAMRALVTAGQVEFTGGGWTQPDEAITRHEDILDVLLLGRRFVRDALGAPPVRTGWAADPFGHSSSLAAIYAASGADAHILGRPMSPMDPINAASSVLWHPLASAPDGGAWDPASTVMTYNTLG